MPVPALVHGSATTRNAGKAGLFGQTFGLPFTLRSSHLLCIPLTAEAEHVAGRRIFARIPIRDAEEASPRSFQRRALF